MSVYATLNSLTNQEVNINIDYSLLNDFIHYSSAVSRIDNFMYKIGEIEGYQYEITTFSPLTSSNASLISLSIFCVVSLVKPCSSQYSVIVSVNSFIFLILH